MGLHLHFMDARGRLTALKPWLVTCLTRTFAAASDCLPLGPTDVILRATGQVIPETGHLGFAPGPGVIFLNLDPDHPQLRANPGQSLERMFAHELHHSARWDGEGYGKSLGAALVAEGLAGQFVGELLGVAPEPWERLARRDWQPYVTEAQRDWDQTSYDHSRWFFGTGDAPRWLGYSLGYQLVATHLAQHEGARAATLVHAPDAEFRPALAAL